MKKILLIGLKDLRIVFRDRPALLLMLLAPFLLTLGMGFVTGRFTGSKSGLSDIPVIIVNQDKAQLGNALVDAFKSTDLSTLVKATEADDPAAARHSIDQDQAAAAIIIPAGFSTSTLSDNNASAPAQPLKIEVYTNPTSPTSAGIIQTIVEEFLGRVEIGRVAGQVTMTQLVTSGLVSRQDAGKIASAIGLQQATTDVPPVIGLKTADSGQASQDFDILAYLAPGMALMFLMYTVSYGGRSLLSELRQGTLPRLLVSPTSTTQVLGGKVLGIYLTGVAQMSILILASTLLFNLKWGDPFGVTVLVLAAVFGATGWGMLLTAMVRTPAQMGGLGTTLMLIFGILGGSFISLNNMPPFVQAISKITPNSWGLDGFTTLALGGNLGDISQPIMALFLMGALLFVAAVIVFNRRGLIQK
jgi:ABC-2 type transport system permease protein